jgi:hypothetical protein
MNSHPKHRSGFVVRLGGALLALIVVVPPSAVIRGEDPPPPSAAPSRSAIAQQKSTMASMKAIAAAWETCFHDFSTYCPPKMAAPDLQWDNIKPAELQALLVPTYIQELPLQDGWSRPLQFAVRCTTQGHQSYGIRSMGGDGRWDADSYANATRTLKAASDIVFSDGRFLQSPEGMGR